MTNLGRKYTVFIIPDVSDLGCKMLFTLQGGADSKFSLFERPLHWVLLTEKLVKIHSREEEKVNLKVCCPVEDLVGGAEKKNETPV